MRSVLVLTMFGMLLFHPGVSSAETYSECLAQCSREMSLNNANCPPPGDETRNQCLQENQETMKHCIDSCQPAAPVDKPKNTPEDTLPTDTPKDN